MANRIRSSQSAIIINGGQVWDAHWFGHPKWQVDSNRKIWGSQRDLLKKSLAQGHEAKDLL
jgi:hypothetical protein